MTKKEETNKVQDPKNQLIECMQQKEEMQDLLQRLQADFENHKKHSEKNSALTVKNANRNLIQDILPILDSFELALNNTDNHETFVKGVELLYSQFTNILKQQGVRKIDISNQKFDHNKHEVLLREESKKEEGTILEELQSGYMMADSVLRYSKVKIATNEKEEQKDNSKDKAE
jgi:molecular chaperone GrpE